MLKLTRTQRGKARIFHSTLQLPASVSACATIDQHPSRKSLDPNPSLREALLTTLPRRHTRASHLLLDATRNNTWLGCLLTKYEEDNTKLSFCVQRFDKIRAV
ncbi:unnamed protein product, partial [Ectocarpus sp. 13 AM-2016]